MAEAASGGRPLAGLRVVDVTHVMAGPFCTYQLALMGAAVLRIEPLEGEDPIRAHGGDAELNRRGMGTSFLAQNAGKRSLGLNLKHAEGQAIFRRLAARAEVIVENFRPGAMERLGLGAAAMRALNPGLVYCAISGFGQEGPLKNRPAYDHIIQAMSGMMSVTGTRATGPLRVGFPLTDYVAGLLAAFAVAAALVRRARTGEGETIDVAMLDAALVIMGPLLTQTLITGREPPPAGNLPFGGSPFSGIFATADGLLAVVGSTPRQCANLCGALGLADLAQDPRVAAWSRHPELAGEVAPRLAAAFLGRTAAAWEEALAAVDVPAGKVRGLGEMLGHPHVASRGLMFATDHVPGIERDIRVPGAGFRLAGAPATGAVPPPLRGAHTREVLRELGYDDAAIDALAASGTVAVN